MRLFKLNDRTKCLVSEMNWNEAIYFKTTNVIASTMKWNEAIFIKLTAFLFFLFVLFTSSVAVANPNTNYQKANEWYAQKKYTEAIKLYEGLIKNDMLTADIYYNLGNAYYKTRQIPKAILNYEKALKLSPDHEDAIFNLRIANTQTIDKLESAPLLFIENTWNNLVTSRTTNSWAYYTVGLLFISLLLLISYLLSHQVLIKKSGFYGGLFFLVLALFCWTMASQSNSYHKKSAEAIVFTETVTVKSEPNASSEKLFTLHEGTKVGVLETINDWTKIKLPNGTVGWLKTNDVKTI